MREMSLEQARNIVKAMDACYPDGWFPILAVAAFESDEADVREPDEPARDLVDEVHKQGFGPDVLQEFEEWAEGLAFSMLQVLPHE